MVELGIRIWAFMQIFGAALFIILMVTVAILGIIFAIKEKKRVKALYDKYPKELGAFEDRHKTN